MWWLAGRRFAIQGRFVMKRLSWEIELQCSQCGAPISLEETDRLLTCSYCHVKLYLWTPSQFCYCLPALKASSENLIFIPYWRFKGVAYSVIPFEVRHRFLDATLLASSHRMLPVTLGIKPQALKLRFASGEIKGTFVKPQLSLQEAVMRIQKQFQVLEGSLLNRPPFHREFIGELGSLIFFPVFVRNGAIVDGILGKVIGPERDLVLNEAPSGIPEQWQIKPISTLCPNCGNALKGGRESILLFCTICHGCMEPLIGQVGGQSVQGHPRKTRFLSLPSVLDDEGGRQGHHTEIVCRSCPGSQPSQNDPLRMGRAGTLLLDSCLQSPFQSFSPFIKTDDPLSAGRKD
jgi:hypothetical protein